MKIVNRNSKIQNHKHIFTALAAIRGRAGTIKQPQTTFSLHFASFIYTFDKMFRTKKSILLIIGAILFASCLPKEHLADCNSTTGSYVCFNYEGRDAIYARWNFDTVNTYNAFDIQGSYPAIPGTTGPWTTVNLTLVNSTGNMVMETGLYTYNKFLTDSGERKFNFWVKHYEGDAKDPDVKNFILNPYGSAFVSITNVDMTGKLTGLFEADVWNKDDTTETAFVKYRFTDIPLQ